MRKNFICILILVLTHTFVQAQNKKELLEEIKNLKSELATTTANLVESKKNEKISFTKAESVEEQIKELRATNASLLKNVSSFTEASTKKTNNINGILESLKAKEEKLKAIENSLNANDSIALLVLTNAKKSLGEGAKIGVEDGAVVLLADLPFLFGSDTGTTISDPAAAWLKKVADLLNTSPTTAVSVEALSMTGEWDVALMQAAAVAGALETQYGITPDRVLTKAKDGNFKEGVRIKIHPKFDGFYNMVKENIKHGNLN